MSKALKPSFFLQRFARRIRTSTTVQLMSSRFLEQSQIHNRLPLASSLQTPLALSNKSGSQNLPGIQIYKSDDLVTSKLINQPGEQPIEFKSSGGNKSKKRMRDSFCEVVLLFKSNHLLREEYAGLNGNVRLGLLFEDLDALSGSIAYQHCNIGEEFQNIEDIPISIVTASVDRIDLLRRINFEEDIRIYGFVSHVGSSSMQISIFVETLPDKQSVKSFSISTRKGPVDLDNVVPYIGNHGNSVLTAKFTMVARDPKTKRSTTVPPLDLVNEDEKNLFADGQEHKSIKRRQSEASLFIKPPTAEESLMIHEMFLNMTKPQNKESTTITRAMSETEMESIILCQPQDRNIHNNIFGGYLMRLSFELAYANACIYSNSWPFFLSLDDIVFKLPVAIGSILNLKSKVTYAAGSPHRSIQVSVVADVIDPLTASRKTTNTFHYSFSAPRDSKVPRVQPSSYAESMAWLEGKRRRQFGMEMANKYSIPNILQ